MVAIEEAAVALVEVAGQQRRWRAAEATRAEATGSEGGQRRALRQQLGGGARGGGTLGGALDRALGRCGKLGRWGKLGGGPAACPAVVRPVSTGKVAMAAR